MTNYTVRWNGKETTITGIPDEQQRYWDENIKIKFYHRGKRSYPRYTATGKFKAPRNETQLYINGKYFLQFSWNLSKESEDNITAMIRYFYCYGYDLTQIKKILKLCFYQ